MRHPLATLTSLALLAIPAAGPATASAAEADEEARLRGIVAALRASGPTAFGHSLFPRDAEVEWVGVEDGRRVLHLRGSFDLAGVPPPLAEVIEELRLETWLGALTAAGVEGGVEVRLRSGGGGGWRRLGGEPALLTVEEPRAPRSIMPRPTPRLPLGGALVGRRIAISAGHGWLLGTNGWETQRSDWYFVGCGTCRGITEDFFNAEFVSNQLVPLLERMGAEVVLVRDPDLSVLPRAVLDDADGAGTYQESGTWNDGTSPGGWSGGYRTNAPGAGGVATFTASLSAPGYRQVGLRWLAGTNRTTGAIAEVRHAGGSTLFDLDQTVNGSFFLDLGRFWFATDGALLLCNGGSGYLIADAVKIGGGIEPASAKPWWQMAAKTYVPWSGASSTVTSAGDVTIRPRFVSAIGADVYVSFHGNASGASGGSTANGTSTYRYNCSMVAYPDHSSSDAATGCDYPPGSKALLDLMQSSILTWVRSEWDPNWGNRGKLVANFGELRELSSSIPGVLVESGFFDNLQNPSGNPPPRMADNKAMHDPRWREAFSSGIAEALAAYLNPGSHVPPARPDGLRAINRGDDGSLVVRWNAVPNASGYLVYRLSDPVAGGGRARAFDAGTYVTATELVLSDLTPRTVYAFKVAAVDANGVGLASPCVSVRFRGARNMAHPAAEALYLGAYDRRDSWVQDQDNDLCYAVEHGQALAGFSSADVFFDGALDEVVESGAVALGGYRLVDFAAGKDSVASESISTAMQAVLQAYLTSGGRMLLSGEEIGYDLAQHGDPPDTAFFDQVLEAIYVSDDANAHSLHGVAGGPFAALGDVAFDDGTKGVYAVHYPDVLAAKAGASSVALTYPDGSGAAIATGRLIFVGAPLETVVPDSDRARLFEMAVAHLAPGIAVGDLDLDGASDACELAAGTDWRDAASTPVTCEPGPDAGPVAGEDAGAVAGEDAGTIEGEDAGPSGGDDGGTVVAGEDAANGSEPDAEQVECPDASEEEAGPDASTAVPGPDAGAAGADAGTMEAESSCGCSAGFEPMALLGLAAVMALRRRRAGSVSDRGYPSPGSSQS